MARWWSLHEDLHAATQLCAELAWKLHVATQVPAQLVGLVATCERRWRLGWCGPGSGLADALGKGQQFFIVTAPAEKAAKRVAPPASTEAARAATKKLSHANL